MRGSLQLRTRTEHWSWFPSTVENQYTFQGSLLRAGIGQQAKWLGWRLEVAAPLLLNLPAQSQAPPPQGAAGLGPSYWAANDSAEEAAGLFLKQVYLRLSRQRDSATHALRFGRFEFIEGSETVPADSTLARLERERIAHRLLGNFAWSHVQRSFDGAHYTYDRSKLQMTLVASRATQGVFRTNGWPELKVNVGYAALNRRPHAAQHSDWRVFAIYYRDDRDVPVPLKADNRPLALRQSDVEPVALNTIGAHYVHVLTVDSAVIDLLAWGALQRGSWGTLDHGAYAFSLEAGWQPPAAVRPWLRAGYTRTSGDDAPLDDQHNTFFQILPTPRIYARFPLYNLMNIEDAFITLMLRPSKVLQIQGQVHSLRLTESNDLWYLGGGAYDKRSFGYTGRPSGGEHGLGTLLDLSADLRISTTLSLNGYLGHLLGGAVIDGVYPAGSRATLGYLELEWRK